MKQPSENIITLLNQQLAQLDAMLLLLSEELHALTQRDIELLDSLVKKKSILLEQISAVDQELATIPDMLNVRQQDWFTTSVAAIETKLENCKTQTQINQQVLEQSQVTLQRLKNELLSSKGKSGLTYTNKGQPAVENKGPGIKA